MMLHIILSLLFLVLVNIQPANSKCNTLPPVTITGRLNCDTPSLPPVEVIVLQRIGLVIYEIGRGYSNGNFKITGSPLYTFEELPDMFVKVRYGDRSQNNALLVSYADHYDVGNVDTTSGPKTIDMGTLKLRRHRCHAFAIFHKAVEDHYVRVGKKIKWRPLVFVDEPIKYPTVARPYVDYDAVISTKDFEWDLQIAKHEIAHIVRHILDGDENHFALDKKEFGEEGLRYHDCSLSTSEGFAFNEGWAFFWAGECLESDENGPYQKGGNVAAALRRIQKLCGTSDADMVLVLEMNPAVIHSYSEFEEKHRELYGCP